MQAYAYIVGPQDTAWSSLFRDATELGFTGVSSFRGLSQVERQVGETPLFYFLFSAVPDVAQLREVARAIRFCANPAIRFSPMVYCAEELSVETTLGCINLGFDDIISLPQPKALLHKRLERQVSGRFMFYEASNYFGPDRRNRSAAVQQGHHQGRHGGPFRRMQITRHVRDGISVERDETLRSVPGEAAMQTLQ